MTLRTHSVHASYTMSCAHTPHEPFKTVKNPPTFATARTGQEPRFRSPGLSLSSPSIGKGGGKEVAGICKRGWPRERRQNPLETDFLWWPLVRVGKLKLQAFCSAQPLGTELARRSLSAKAQPPRGIYILSTSCDVATTTSASRSRGVEIEFVTLGGKFAVSFATT